MPVARHVGEPCDGADFSAIRSASFFRGGANRTSAATARRRGPMLRPRRPERPLRDFPRTIAALSDHGNSLSRLKLPTERAESNSHRRAVRRLI